MSRTGRASLLAFAVAFVTLFTQVLVHRLVTAKLANNFAFLVISLTMLGFALSSVVLTRRLDSMLRRLPDAVVLSASLFCLTLVGAAALFCSAPAKGWIESRSAFVWDFFRLMPLSLLFALPFAFCGLVLGALLAAPDLNVRRIYCADLVGSAMGAFAVLPAVSLWGVEQSLLAACALMLGAGFLLGPPGGRTPRSAALLAALVLAASALSPSRVLALRYPDGTILADAQRPGGGVEIEHIAWDPVARIELSRVAPPDPDHFPFPSLIGTHREFLARFRKVITQNNNAFTYAVDYDGRRESLRGIEETIYAAAYEAGSVAHPSVLAVGVGGGFDILAALYFGASEVTGVEVNGATLDILTRTHRPYFRHWVEDPRVRLVHAEGRHYLAGLERRFDVLELSGVDSASGTPGAAHVFSENYLYTAEAFDLYLSRLEEGGILCVMRPEFSPPREMLRALVTAVEALRRAGRTEPRRHVVMLTASNGNIVSMLVKKTPFEPSELGRLEAWASGSRVFGLSASPRDGPDAPRRLHRIYLGQGTPEREASFVSLYPFDISPVTDDRPFFFKYSTWSHLFSRNPAVAASIPVMEISVLLLLALTGLSAVGCVYAPLRYLTGQGRTNPGAWRFGVFFACTGMGYLALEVALLQKFSLFLGHPNYALSVVLAALLLFTGLGAMAAERIVGLLGGLRRVALWLAALILVEHFLVMPRLLGHVGTPFALRCGLVCALVAPLGGLLGVFLPTVLNRLKEENLAFVPWAWGINGIASVVAPVVSIGVSTTFGIGVLLLSALPFYLLAGWVLQKGSPP